MSLDVSLVIEKWVSYDEGKTYKKEDECVYDANITHNLGNMARESRIYEALWRPYKLRKEFENKFTIRAEDIIKLLEEGLTDLKAKPKYFEQFNSPNSWGMYEHFVPFVEKYLNACKENPKCLIRTSR